MKADELEVKKIIGFYRKLYFFVFNLGIYVLLVILTLPVLFLLDVSKSYSIQLSDTTNPVGMTKIQDGYKANMIYYDDMSFSGLDINLLGGYIYNQGGIIYSYNNVVTFSGVVLPYMFSLPDDDKQELVSISSPKAMQTYIERFLLSQRFQSLDINIIKPKLNDLEDNSLQKTFALDCIDAPFLTYFCKNNIQVFGAKLKDYDVHQDALGIRDLMPKFDKIGYKKQYCDAMSDYMFANKDFSAPVENTMYACGKQYYDKFLFIKNADQINEEIIDNNISNRVYDSKLLNEYKLVSMQKLLTKYIQNNKYNDQLFTSYFDFLGELLKKINQDVMDAKYLDMIYLYNNLYLDNALVGFLNQNKETEITEKIKNAQYRLSNINKGDDLYGYQGLSQYMSTPRLVDMIAKIKKGEKEQEITTSVTSFASYLDEIVSNYAQLEVIDKEIDEQNQIYKYYTIFTYEDQAGKNYESRIMFVFRPDPRSITSFNVFRVLIQNNEEASSLVNKNIKDKELPLRNVIPIIEQALNLSGGPKMDLDICDVWKQISKQLRQSNIKINNQLCEADQLSFNINDITYTFLFENNRMTNYYISDQELQTKAKQQYGEKQLLIDEVSSFIIQVVNLQKDETNPVDTSTSDQSRVLTKLNTMLGVLSRDARVKEKSPNIFVVEFQLQGVLIQGIIDISDNYRLYDLRLLKEKGRAYITIKVDGFELNLVGANSTQINFFKNKPLEYIQELDTDAYEQYIAE